MNKLVIIWAFIILLHINNSFLQNPCGVPKIRIKDLIRYGNDTEPGAWPWHVAVYHKDRRTDSYACGGTLISELFVLTAAHCVLSRGNGHQLSTKRIFVRLGVHNLDELNTKTLQQHALEMIYRPSSNNIRRNDIALLELATVALFNDYVQPACVSLTKDLTGQFGTVIGWGVTENDNITPTLKSVRMPTVDPVTCLESNRALFGATLDGGVFCAGYTNGTTVCNGDSGGGIFFSKDNVWYLGGIVSFSELRSEAENLCYTSGYAGFTKVYFYLPWISSITKQTLLIEEEIFPAKNLLEDKADPPCRTPTNKTGQCVTIHRCQNIYNLITSNNTLSLGISNYIKQAACSMPNVRRSVCCQPTEIVKNRRISVSESMPIQSKIDLLPKDCGQTANYLIAYGNVTKLFAYPWMAVLLVDVNGTTQYTADLCAGTLIHKRYILTAGTCVRLRSHLRLVKVILGEHTKHQDDDCNLTPFDDLDCADSIKFHEIESFVTPPDFDRPRYSNNIGLIRLKQDVIMQDNIQPICLPVTPALRTQQLQQFIVTGWGKTENSTSSNVLLEAIVPRVDNIECQQIFAKERLNVSDKLLCAGGQNMVDTCRGDAGGPLGYIADYQGAPRFVQFGITSIGVDSCGVKSVPSLYTRVSSYMDWILDNIEP